MENFKIQFISKKLKSLPNLNEKLKYWFDEVIPNTTTKDGIFHKSIAEDYFKHGDLSFSAGFGYIPYLILKRHFYDCNENNIEYVEFMAWRDAESRFKSIKAEIQSTLKLNKSTTYLERWKDKCKEYEKISVQPFEIELGLKGTKELSDIYLFQNLLKGYLISCKSETNRHTISRKTLFIQCLKLDSLEEREAFEKAVIKKYNGIKDRDFALLLAALVKSEIANKDKLIAGAINTFGEQVGTRQNLSKIFSSALTHNSTNDAYFDIIEGFCNELNNILQTIRHPNTK